MRIILVNDNAFIDFGSGYLICIGTRVEVETALAADDDEKIRHMIQEAVVQSQYNSIENTKRQTKH